MTTYNKPPLTINQQIEKLELRGLTISNHQGAQQCLTNVGFYRLSAYFIPYEKPPADKRNHQFQDTTEFDDIFRLYTFDQKLRLLVMEAIERIEVAVRTQWANEMSLNHNDAHAFMHSELFDNPWEHQKQLAKVSNGFDNSKEVFAKHYRDNYQQPFLPPIWAMVETLTFGELSKWFKNTKTQKLKQNISRQLGLPTVQIMESLLSCLSLIRNICAHHGRLWNRSFTKKLPLIKKLRDQLTITTPAHENGKTQSHVKENIYNYLIVICHIMKKIKPTSHWQQRLAAHIDTATTSQQLRMGFPSQWRQKKPWQNS